MDSQIQNIIFDFGGVILNLDESLTYTAFAGLLACPQPELHQKLNQNNLFRDFECGNISIETFLDRVKQLTPKPISSEQITNAWNAMLLDFPVAHIDLLLSLKSKYRTFLLSNTNALHEQAFTMNMKKQGIPYAMEDLFETVWYSHKLGKRKPDHDIFEEVINRAGLEPSETLFLDDRQDNIRAAAELGLHTQLITKDFGILSYFKNLQ